MKFADQLESNAIPVLSAHTSVVSQATKTPVGVNWTAIQPIGTFGVSNVKTRGRIVISFTADATDIVESEECSLKLPIVLYEDVNGRPGRIVSNQVLTFDNMTGFTAAGTVDITATAAVPARICYYDVPRGLIAGLDPRGKFHVYMGDDA